MRKVWLAGAIAMAVVAVVVFTTGGGGGVNKASIGAGGEGERGKPIAGQYIVQIEKGRDPEEVARGAGASPQHVYRSVLNGFAGKLTEGQLNGLRRNPNVTLIEQDAVVTADVLQSQVVSSGLWGLDRIDQRSMPLNSRYTYENDGTGASMGRNVTAYVLDTGLRSAHQEFSGRASGGFSSVGGTGEDCNGHGTHVGGTIGGTRTGVAKGVKLVAVRVLNCTGSGTYSGVIAGLDWVRNNARRPAVANMSLGGGVSSSVDYAVTNLVSSGVMVVVAAGNSAADACNTSPARTPSAYTVAASTRNDARASFSNHSSCVDGYAPGEGIESAWYSSDTAYNTISGTSMAAPHVAGVAALYMARTNASPAATTSWLNSNAVSGVITGNVGSTPNRLVHKAAL